MNIDRWIGIVGLVLAAFGIWLAFYFYRKTIRTKLLTVLYTDQMPLFVGSPEVTFTYYHEVREQVTRLFILLWNQGTSPIESSDFIDPILVEKPATLLQLHVLDKDPAAHVLTKHKERTIRINLLRPGEAAVLMLDSTEREGQLGLSINMKAADMSTVVKSPYKLRRLVLPIALVWVLLSGTFAFFLLQSDLPNHPVPLIAALSISLTIFVPIFGLAIIAAAGGQFLDRLEFRSWHPVVRRFVELDKEVGSIAATSWYVQGKLKTLIDGLMDLDRHPDIKPSNWSVKK